MYRGGSSAEEELQTSKEICSKTTAVAVLKTKDMPGHHHTAEVTVPLATQHAKTVIEEATGRLLAEQPRMQMLLRKFMVKPWRKGLNLPS